MFAQDVQSSCNKASKFTIAASGTSNRVKNLNPTASDILKKCHRLLERIHRKRARRDAVMAVHNARKRTKYLSIQPGVVTRLGSYQKEVGIFNCTRHDLHQFLHDMLDEGGCDNELMKGEHVDPDEVQNNGIFCSNRRATLIPFTSWLSSCRIRGRCLTRSCLS